MKLHPKIMAVSALSVLTLLIIWNRLPHWAPQFTYKHSPFMGPVVACMMHNPGSKNGIILCGSSTLGEYTILDCSYLKHKFNASIIPHVTPYTNNSDPKIRMRAGLMLLQCGLKGKNMYNANIYDPHIFDTENIETIIKLMKDNDVTVSGIIIRNLDYLGPHLEIDNALQKIRSIQN